jgi:hypothetical protein
MHTRGDGLHAGSWHGAVVAIGAHDFPLEPGLTLLNHASYGIATRRSLAIAGEIRERPAHRRCARRGCRR